VRFLSRGGHAREGASAGNGRILNAERLVHREEKSMFKQRDDGSKQKRRGGWVWGGDGW